MVPPCQLAFLAFIVMHSAHEHFSQNQCRGTTTPLYSNPGPKMLIYIEHAINNYKETVRSCLQNSWFTCKRI